MSVDSPWLALSADWMDSEMFDENCTDGCRLAWVILLCHVKLTGRAGRAKVRAKILARRYGLSERSVSDMLKIAREHGAIELDDDVVTVVNWSTYQVDRVKGLRGKAGNDQKKGEKPPTRTRTQTHTRTQTDTAASAASADAPSSPRPTRTDKPQPAAKPRAAAAAAADVRPEFAELETRLGRPITASEGAKLDMFRRSLEAEPIQVDGKPVPTDEAMLAAIGTLPPDVRFWHKYLGTVIADCRADGVMPGDASPSNRGTFKPPTVAEVEAYCRENKCKVDAAAFVSHYEAVGWKRGGNQITDWRAQVRAWDARRRSEESDPSSPNYVPKLKDGWED